MRLDELPDPYKSRLIAARDPAAWSACCADPRATAWIAWNVIEDAWYEDGELDQIKRAIDSAPSHLAGSELLVHIASSLLSLRRLTSHEQAHLPLHALTHIAGSWLFDRYTILALAEGTLEGESRSTVVPGDRFKVAPKLGARLFAWLTFDTPSQCITTELDAPDKVARYLGLDWGPAHGVVIRIEVPLRALLSSGRDVHIPTVFNSLRRRPLHADWRARPRGEHRPEEPWGMTRDMQLDGPALPEVLMEITSAGAMAAECMEKLANNWSERPFLMRTSPR